MGWCVRGRLADQLASHLASQPANQSSSHRKQAKWLNAAEWSTVGTITTTTDDSLSHEEPHEARRSVKLSLVFSQFLLMTLLVLPRILWLSRLPVLVVVVLRGKALIFASLPNIWG